MYSLQLDEFIRGHTISLVSSGTWPVYCFTANNSPILLHLCKWIFFLLVALIYLTYDL